MNDYTIYEAIKQGILICDSKMRIEYFNTSYGEFIGHTLDEVKGRPLIEIRPGASAPKVLATGKEMRALLRKENDVEYFTDIYPIKEKGKTVGTVSVVTLLADAAYIKDKLEELERESAVLRDRLDKTNGTQYTFDDIIGESEALLLAKDLAKKVSGYDSPLLLNGESGSGKELFAQAIHNESKRKLGPFVAINCAAISKSLLESELFGYESGAFTGARKGGKPGLFETAKGGTLFLDEISEMDYELQAKLLRVLQENKLRRIGGNKEIKTDVRLICACNVSLMQYIEEKKFRRDLYYRVAGVPITIPPLRERRDDILPLAEHFLQMSGIQHKRKYVMNADTRKLFLQYDWPGNIRELRNTVDYAAIMAVDGDITGACLPPTLTSNLGDDAATVPLSRRVSEFERREILKEVQQFGTGTEAKRKAAEVLGISLSSLYAKLGK